jgi:hypothetical protein
MIAEPSQAFNYYDSDLARNLDNFRFHHFFRIHYQLDIAEFFG